MGVIVHITTASAWQHAQQEGEYTDASLRAEGFIHCSRPDQVARVLDEKFPDRSGLVYLRIDSARLRAEVRDEDLYDSGETFPHVYGPVNLEAVVGVEPVGRG